MQRVDEFFPRDYADGRARFLALTQAAGFSTTSFVHPARRVYKGGGGEAGGLREREESGSPVGVVAREKLVDSLHTVRLATGGCSVKRAATDESTWCTKQVYWNGHAGPGSRSGGRG